MAAAVTERFGDHYDFCLAESFAKVGTQMVSSGHRSAAVNVVSLVDFPPWIKNGARW